MTVTLHLALDPDLEYTFVYCPNDGRDAQSSRPFSETRYSHDELTISTLPAPHSPISTPTHRSATSPTVREGHQP